MADTNINIYFSNEKASGSPSNPLDENKPDSENPTNPKNDNGSKAVGSAVALKLIKTGTQQAAARAGQIYGSNQLQEKINAVGSLVSYGAAIAINPVMGLSMMALDMGFQLVDHYVGRKNEQRTLSVLQERAGSSLNRSR